MLHAFLALSLAVKVFYIAILVAAIGNLLATFMPRIKPHWRFHFGYTAVLLSLYAGYIALRLGGALDPRDYALLVQWLFPLLVFPFVIPILLIRWESKFFKQALERQADAIIESGLDR